MRRGLLAAALVLAAALGGAREARAQYYAPTAPLNRNFYYPGYYFPHNYWPTAGPRWPEPAGQPYMRPPAYMAYPPYLEQNWRYDLWQRMTYYRGSHFWLDQF
jgi:hypothetical protein